MQVIAGERSVTIRLTYDQADELTMKLSPGYALWETLAEAVAVGRAKGRPLPPLPKIETVNFDIVVKP